MQNKYKTVVEPNLFLVKMWSRDGLTDQQIANNLGISESTLYEYKNKYPEFSETLKKSKEAADYEVENALYKRATGYTVTETVEEQRDEKTLTKKTISKEIPGDVTAQIYWLKNRCPQKWRDRNEHISPQEKAIEKLDAVLLAIETQMVNAPEEDEKGKK